MKKTKFYWILAVTLLISGTQNASADFQKLLNYQGRLTDSNGIPLADGSYNMVFEICTLLTAGYCDAGAVVWTESHTGGAAETVEDGLFSAVLGGTTSFNGVDFNSTNYWIQVSIGATTYAPPQKLAAAPMALNVPDSLINSNKVADNSLTAADLSVNVVSSLSDGTTTVLNDGGNITLAAGTGISVSANDDTNTITISTGSGGSAPDHGTLQGLTDDDHTQYFALSQNETVTGRPAFDGGTSGTSSPFTVDSNTTVSLLNADLLDDQHGSYYYNLDSLDGVTNDGGNIDLVASGSITITPNDALNTITFTVSNSAIDHGTLTGLGDDDHTQYLNLSQNETMTGSITMSGTGADLIFNNTGGAISNSAGDVQIADAVAITGVITSSVADGTAPMAITSTTKVANLNADLLDGLDSTAFMTASADSWVNTTGDTMTGTLIMNNAALNMNNTGGDIVFNNTGGAISNSAGDVQIADSVTVTGVLTSTVASGTAPFAITSGSNVTNLNADMLDSYHAGNTSGNIPVSNGTVNTNLNADLLDGLSSADFMSSSTDNWVNTTGDTMTGALTMNNVAISMSGGSADIAFNHSGGTITLAGGTITDSAGAVLLSDTVTINNLLTMTGTNGDIAFDHASGTISLAGGNISDSVGGVIIADTLQPGTDATYDLGVTGSGRWRNLYLSGTANLGDISCTDCLNATEIEDIYVFNTGDAMTGALTMSNAAISMSGANADLTFDNAGGNITLAGGTITDSVGAVLLSDTVTINNLLTMNGANGDITFNNAGGAITLAGGTITDSVGAVLLSDTVTINNLLTMTGANGDITFDNAGGAITLAGGAITDSVGAVLLSDTVTINNTLTMTGASGDIAFDNAGGTISNSAADVIIADNLSPDTTNTKDLGSATIMWKNLYLAGTANLGDISCTDCLNATEIEDIYVFNTGDEMTGALTMNDSAISMSGANADITFSDAGGSITLAGGTITDSVGAVLLSDTVTINNLLTMNGASADITFNSAGGNLTLNGGTITDTAGPVYLSDTVNINNLLTMSGANADITFNNAGGILTLASGYITDSIGNLKIADTLQPNADATYDLGVSGTARWANLYLSGTANVGDLSCTDCLNDTEITDIYVFTAGDDMVGALTMSLDGGDVLEFTASSTNDSRGIAFNDRAALTADYNDGYLRLNAGSGFTNGVTTPLAFWSGTTVRADSGYQIDGNTVIDGVGQFYYTRNTSTNKWGAVNGSGFGVDALNSSDWDLLVYEDGLYIENLRMGYGGTGSTISTYDAAEALTINTNTSGNLNLLTSGTGNIVTGQPIYPDADNAHEIGIDKTNAYSKLNLEQGIELRWALPSTPYIDFSNDNTADYDARIILNSDTLLSILDANLTIQGTTYPTADATYDLGISGTNRWRNLYLSGTANVVDLACTDCINSTEITDIYVFNTSDTMSGSLSIGTTLGVTGNTTITGGSLSLNNGTSNKITWSDVGVGNPATAAAWRAQYYTDYGRGIESSTLWDRSTRYFKWYDSSDNTNYKMQLDNDASTPTLTVGSVNLTGSDLTYGGRAYIYTMAYANNGWTYCYEDGWVTPNCMDSGGVVRYGGDCNTFTGRFICEYAHAY